MVAPYMSKPLDINEAYMHKFDISKSEILKKKGLSEEEKLNLCNQLLNRYLLKKENNNIKDLFFKHCIYNYSTYFCTQFYGVFFFTKI